MRVAVEVPGIEDGRYRVVCWDTVAGEEVGVTEQVLRAGVGVRVEGLVGDLAVALRRVG